MRVLESCKKIIKSGLNHVKPAKMDHLRGFICILPANFGVEQLKIFCRKVNYSEFIDGCQIQEIRHEPQSGEGDCPPNLEFSWENPYFVQLQYCSTSIMR
jgi:hypothetical protein